MNNSCSERTVHMVCWDSGCTNSVLLSFVDVDILGLSLCSFWSNVPAFVVLPSTLRFWLLKSVHTASECQLLSDFRLCLSTESEYRFSFSWIFLLSICPFRIHT